MSIFKDFATDNHKENDGVKIEYSPNSDGSIPSVTVRRSGKSNKRYAKALEAATKPFKRQIETGTLDNATAETLFKKVFVDSVLTGWENIQDESGNVIAFSKENALALFEKLPEFYDDVQEQSKKISNFRNDSLESDAKN